MIWLVLKKAIIVAKIFHKQPWYCDIADITVLFLSLFDTFFNYFCNISLFSLLIKFVVDIGKYWVKVVNHKNRALGSRY